MNQRTTLYNCGEQKSISECATRRTLRWMGCNSRRCWAPLLSAKNRKLRLQWAQAQKNWTVEDWKNVAWSDESRFLLRHTDGRVRFGTNSMNHGPNLPCVNSPGWCRWCNGVGNAFLAHFGPVNTNQSSSLNATAYLSIVADHVHPFMATMYPSSNGYFQRDDAPCRKAKVVSNWVHEHNRKFSVLQWPAQSPDLNPIDHLWSVVEREICRINLHDAIILGTRNRISKECFQRLVGSMPQRIDAVLRAKGGPS